MESESTARVHWSFWLIGGIALAFNAMGCVNYLWQMDAENVAAMPDIYQTIIETRPPWATAAFAIAVFGGLAGAILLLMKKRVALYAFVASTLGAVIAQLPNMSIAGLPPEAWIGGLVQVGVGAFLIWYTKHSAAKGWL